MEKKSGQFSGGRTYRNEELTVYWKPSACVHASYCFRELIEVFDPGRRPWVDINAAPVERIIEVVDMCPTEALTWKWNEEEKNNAVGPEHTNHVKYRRPELMAPGAEEEKEKPVSVKVLIDGPVLIKGDFTMIYGGNEKQLTDGVISICRCGKSDKLPFCDGRHHKTGFVG